MENIMNNARFAEAFRKLAGVRLNPRRHTALNALAHSEAVAAHAVALARLNHLSDRELGVIENLGRAHDIGKINGTARPEQSLVVLAECGVHDPGFNALVKWHDTSLPWYISSTRGQPPSDKAWRRLASEVEVRLLALFMVADRVDAPPGWRRNAPTVWFLEQARQRGLIGDLELDLPHHPSEVSAGGVVVRELDGARELLVIRVRARSYEIPKGGIEWDELPADAAAREAREEAGISTQLVATRELSPVEYPIGEGPGRHLKRVRYFLLEPTEPVQLEALPPRTRERRWLRGPELDSVPLVNDQLRTVLLEALGNVP